MSNRMIFCEVGDDELKTMTINKISTYINKYSSTLMDDTYFTLDRDIDINTLGVILRGSHVNVLEEGHIADAVIYIRDNYELGYVLPAFHVIFIDCSDTFIRNYPYTEIVHVESNSVMDLSQYRNNQILSVWTVFSAPPKNYQIYVSDESTMEFLRFIESNKDIRKIKGNIDSRDHVFDFRHLTDVNIINTKTACFTTQMTKVLLAPVALTLSINDIQISVDTSRLETFTVHHCKNKDNIDFIGSTEGVDLEFDKDYSFQGYRWRSIKTFIVNQQQLEQIEECTDHIKIRWYNKIDDKYHPKSRIITCSELNDCLIREEIHIKSFKGHYRKLHNTRVFIEEITDINQFDGFCQFARALFVKKECRYELTAEFIYHLTDTNVTGLKKPVFEKFYAPSLKQGFKAIATEFESALLNLIAKYIIG